MNQIQQDEISNELQVFCGKYLFYPNQNRNRMAEGGTRLSGKCKIRNVDEPLVTYVTAVRNSKNTILRCMQSVWNQTYKNVEHIIIDGASTDGTIEILKAHENKIDYYISEPDKGIYNAINKGISLAQGDIICILGSDDWVESTAAQVAVDALKNSQCEFIATGTMGHDPAGGFTGYWSPKPVHAGTIFTCMDFCHNAIYATKKTYDLSGPYDESYKVTADFKWVMNCYKKGISMTYTDTVTTHYSSGGISSDPNKNSQDTIRVISEYYPFLSLDECKKLFWTFYSYADVIKEYVPYEGSENELMFIEEIMKKYQKKPDFVHSVGMAVLQKYSAVTKQTVKDSSLSMVKDGILHGFENMGIKGCFYYLLKALKRRLARQVQGTFLYTPLKRIYKLIK